MPPEEVEALGSDWGGVGQRPQPQRQADQTHWNIQKEDPAPPDRSHQESAGQRPRHQPRRYRGEHPSHGAPAFVVRKRIDHQRRADGLQGGAANPLQHPTGDEHPHVDGHPRQQRGSHKGHKPSHKQPPPSQGVRGAAKRQEQARNHQQVRQHHPLQRVEGGVKLNGKRGQREVDGTGVERGHEHAGHDNRQRGPLVRVGIPLQAAPRVS